MMMDIVRYQVDIVAGDANKASYVCKKNQPIPSQLTSSFNIMMKATADFMQGFVGWPYSMGYQMVSSNTQEKLAALDEHFSKEERDWNDQPDIDCILASILSWGHSHSAQAFRQLDEAEAAKAAPNAGISLNREWRITVSEFPMHLSNEHLWLGQNDKDWHTPLNLIIHPADIRNQRKRSDEKVRERAQKYIERFGQSGKGDGKSKGKGFGKTKGKEPGKTGKGSAPVGSVPAASSSSQADPTPSSWRDYGRSSSWEWQSRGWQDWSGWQDRWEDRPEGWRDWRSERLWD